MVKRGAKKGKKNGRGRKTKRKTQEEISSGEITDFEDNIVTSNENSIDKV